MASDAGCTLSLEELRQRLRSRRPITIRDDGSIAVECEDVINLGYDKIDNGVGIKRVTLAAQLSLIAGWRELREAEGSAYLRSWWRVQPDSKLLIDGKFRLFSVVELTNEHGLTLVIVFSVLEEFARDVSMARSLFRLNLARGIVNGPCARLGSVVSTLGVTSVDGETIVHVEPELLSAVDVCGSLTRVHVLTSLDVCDGLLSRPIELIDSLHYNGEHVVSVGTARDALNVRVDLNENVAYVPRVHVVEIALYNDAFALQAKVGSGTPSNSLASRRGMLVETGTVDATAAVMMWVHELTCTMDCVEPLLAVIAC